MDTEDTYENTFENVGETWDESEIRSLITLIKANEFLVNKTNKDFWNKEKKDNAWKIIANLLNRSEVEIQKKWKSLRTVFSRKLALLKVKLPSGSGADAEGKSKNEWEYWGDMQFLTPHMRYKSNRTSNFHKKEISCTTSGLLISPATTKSLTSPAITKSLTSPAITKPLTSPAITIPSTSNEPLPFFTISEPLTFHSNKGYSVIKSAAETYRNKDTIRCSTIESIQNIDSIVSGTPCLAIQSPESDTTLLSSDSSYVETLPASSNDENVPPVSNTNKIQNKIKSNIKNKRKIPAADGFYTKKKKALESYSTLMSEASQSLQQTLSSVSESLKEPIGNDDLQYFACLLPTFKKLNDDQKTECLIKLLNVVKEFGKTM